MRHALALSVILLGGLILAESLVGTDFAIAIGFGAITTIAATNAATFLWLWWARTTPLALGMAYSWLGQAAISIWWFVSGIPHTAPWVTPFDSKILFAVLSIYIVGGIIHISVVQSSVDAVRRVVLLPAIAAFAVALLADALF
ncbi:hypothetical protein [Roseitranquillus sediminis]|uniref:hypothetical protein n=1 Tax=Roseitranquillus sediminis TaxID=2809051 RepID=UPI001D0C3153|nr:hypothetical protein [Roseitranquillus sediminis]MBM9594415.1 hypothetical protein [Roseitranquillus sediminis]